MISRCVNHVYTLSPKLSSKKIRIRFDFPRFHISSMFFFIGKDGE